MMTTTKINCAIFNLRDIEDGGERKKDEGKTKREGMQLAPFILTTNRNNSNTNKNNRLLRLDHYVQEKLNLMVRVDWKVLVVDDAIDYFRRLMNFLDSNDARS